MTDRRPPEADVADGGRPSTSFDPGLQHERTALAWERTAIASMVAGIVLSRFAAIEAMWWAAAVGLAITAFGAGLLVWSGLHYEQLHGVLRSGDSVVHPRATRWVGIMAVTGTGLALVLVVVTSIRS